MAWTRLVSGSTAGNISMNIDYNVTSVSRTSNTNVRVTFGIRFAMSGSTWTSNSVAAFVPAGGTRYFAFNSGSGKSHTNSGTWYYANTSGSTTTSEKTPFTIDIPVTITQTSASFEVGYGWDAWTPSQKGKSSISVSFPTGATAPTGLWCNISSVTESSCVLSGGYSSNGNATVTDVGYQFRVEGGSWTGCGATVTGLAPNTKYYFRYYAANSQGYSYSGENSIVTHQYPYVNSTPDFVIGNVLAIGLYNPLGRKIKVYLIGNDGTEIYVDEYSGTSVSGFIIDWWQDWFYSTIPNSQSGKYKVRLLISDLGRDTTVDGGTYYIKGTEKPTFSASNITNVVDTLHVTDITGNASKIIKGHNKITGNITKMTPMNRSNGSRYVVTASANPSSQELTYDSGATKSFTLDNLTTNSFNVTAYDTRGLSTPITKTVDLIDYNIPKINNLNITRQNGIGEYAILNADGTNTYWNGWSQIKKYNTIQKVYYRYKPSGSSTWSVDWIDISSSLTTNNNGNWALSKTLDVKFTTTTKYDFQLYVEDLLESSQPASNTLSTANGFLWRDLKNKFLGINKKPEKTLDVNGEIAGTKIFANNVDLLNSINTNTTSINNLNTKVNTNTTNINNNTTNINNTNTKVNNYLSQKGSALACLYADGTLWINGAYNHYPTLAMTLDRRTSDIFYGQNGGIGVTKAGHYIVSGAFNSDLNGENFQVHVKRSDGATLFIIDSGHCTGMVSVVIPAMDIYLGAGQAVYLTVGASAGRGYLIRGGRTMLNLVAIEPDKSG